MKVTYICHSDFLVNLDSVTLLFDYWKGNLPEIPDDRPLVVFASHSHHDHYSPGIYEIPAPRAGIRYILSEDIDPKSVPAHAADYTTFIGPDADVTAGTIRIRTLRSNDLGVAFVVETEEARIYHAGDLNNWWWDGSDEDIALEKEYHRELEKIRGMYFDAAFVPLDPRLQDREKGIRDFLRYAKARVIFPMHFWEDYSVMESFIRGTDFVPPETEIVKITHKEESYELHI